MRKFIYFSLLIVVSFIFASCESNEPQKFLAKDTFVSFNKNTAAMNENDTEPTQIPLVLAGVPGGPTVTVKISTSTTGISIPAVEGVDYTIATKDFTFTEGLGTQYIVITPIDNDVFSGNKAFDIIIESVTPELLESVQNTIRVTINDDDHPLANMFGYYMNSGTNPRNDPGYEVKVSAHSDGADNELAFDFGYENPVIGMVLDEDGETYIKFYKDQNLGPVSSYVIHFVWVLHQDGKNYYNLNNDVYASYEDGVISFTTELYGENGIGFLAYSGSSPAGWWEYWYQDLKLTWVKK